VMSVDRESKGIQWPLQDDLARDDDVLNVTSDKKVRQKFVNFLLFSCTVRFFVLSIEHFMLTAVLFLFLRAYLCAAELKR